MSLLAGTATVTANSDGTFTPAGTGMAAAIATAMLPPLGITQAEALKIIAGAGLPALQKTTDTFVTNMANQIAAALVPYLTTNAVITGVTVGTGTGQLT